VENLLRGLQGETALATFEHQFVLAGLQTHGLVGRHGPQDVNQFASTHRGTELTCITAKICVGAYLNFQIAGGQLQAGP